MTGDAPFDVSIDHAQRVIRIQGIRYSFGLFDELAFAPTGARFEVGQRQDGVVELKTIPNGDAR